MTLEKRLIPIDFSGQLDTKTDSKKLPPGNFTLLQNAVRKKGKMFAKRPGSSVISGPAGADARGIVDYKGQLVKFEDDELQVWSEERQEWLSKGPLIPCVARAETMIRGATSYFDVDSASNGTYTVYVYSVTQEGPSYYSVYDEGSKAFIVKDEFVYSGGMPRVLLHDSGFHIYVLPNSGDFYAGDLRRQTYTFANPDIMAFSQHLVSGEVGNPTQKPCFDVAFVPGSTDVLVFWGVHNAAQLKIARFDASGSQVGSTTNVQAEDSDYTACIVPTATLIYCLWYQHVGSGSNLLRCEILDYTFATQVAAFTVASVSHPIVFQAVSAIERYDGSIQVFYQHDGSLFSLYTATVTAAGSVTGTLKLSNFAWLRSKPFKRTVNGTESYYVCAESYSAVDPTYFVMRHDGQVAASFKSGLARGVGLETIALGPCLSFTSVSSSDADTFTFAAVVREKVFTADGVPASMSAVAKTTVDFSQSFSIKKIGENLTIAGGKVSLYDGTNVAELGFHTSPHPPTPVPVNVPGNLDTSKSYQAVCVLEWYDENGMLHRSAPTQPFTWSGPGSTYQMNYDLVPYLLTGKEKVAQVIYRTTGNGTIFYRVSPPFFGPTSPEILETTISDNISDNDLLKNEPLYTTGGILENIGPPNATHVGEFSGRAILSGTEDGSVWFSKKTATNIPVQFSDFLTIPAPDGEAIKGTGVIDEKLILLREKGQPYFTYGDGPDNLGAGAFAQPIQVNTDGALKDTASIVNIPNQGLAFKHPQGIYQIGRDLQSFYFGAPVEDWNDTTIVGTAVDEEKSLVYFFTSEGPTLVYDYGWQQWSTYTVSGVGCTMYQGAASSGRKVLAYIKADGDVHITSDTLFKDGSSHYIAKAITGWLTLAGISGFQRVMRAAFGGKKKTNHTLKIGAGYDYKDAFESEIQFDAADLDAGEAYRIQSHLKTQKCEAIRFSIEEDSDGSEDLHTLEIQDATSVDVALASTAGAGSGQAFTLDDACSLSAVRIWLLAENPVTGTLSMSVYATAAGVPDGAALGTSDTIDLSTLGVTAQQVVFRFATPIPLSALTMYAFTFLSNHTGGPLRFQATSDVYSGGTRVVTTDGGASWSTNTLDMRFALDVYLPTSGEALELDSLTLEVGLKRGLAKLKSSLKVSAT